MLVKKEKIFDNIVAVSGTKKEAIRTISRLCAKQTMLDATQLEKAFWKREEWDSTGCGEGIAIPHAIIKEIDEVSKRAICFLSSIFVIFSISIIHSSLLSELFQP